MDIDEIIILCRDNNQKNYLKPLAKKFHNIKITDKTIELTTIASDCRFFIGSGGSMVRELATLGVPSVSIYRGPSLAVDDFLIDHGYLQRFTTLDFSLEIVDLSHERTDELLLLGRNSFEKMFADLIGSGAVK